MISTAPPRRRSLFGSGSAQFAGQAAGILLAVLVSHLIARRMGVGPDADAFLLGRRLITAVTEALNQIVVAVFIPLVAAQAASGASIWHIISRSGGAALLAGMVLSVLFLAGSPWIVASLAPDFPPETAAVAVRVMRILAIALPATVATIALASYCNVRGTFGSAATIRQLPRAAVVVALLLGTGALAEKAAIAYTLGATFVTLLLLVLAIRLSRSAPSAPKKAYSGAISRRGAAAMVLAAGAMVVLWLETSVAASIGAGAVTMLEYSQRLGALLGNTLAMALTVVVFADLSRRSAAGEHADMDVRFNRSLWAGLAMMLPVTIGVIVQADPIIELVLGYGAFRATDIRIELVEMTRLMAIAPLGALVLRMLYVRVLADERLPVVRIAIVATVAEVAIRVMLFKVLVPWLGLTGIPVGLIIAPVGASCVIGVWLYRRGHVPRLRPTAASRALVMTSLLTCLAIFAGAWLGTVLPAAGEKTAALSSLLVCGLCGAVVPVLAVTLFKVRLR